MTYMFIVVIGAVAGWVVGQMMKGSEHGAGVDVAAGALGAAVVVVLVRLIGPASASGMMISAIVSVIGAIAALYAVRRVMTPKPVVVARRRR